MRVLVACEFSGVVRDAFIRQGHDAWSCDVLPTEVVGPHIQGDVRDHLHDGWDLMIAHPPCTYLSRAGARWLYPTAGNIDPDRYQQGCKARDFFYRLLYRSSIPMVAVENPTPFKVFDLPPPSQVVQPFQFGDPFSKRTLLWLRGLPNLVHTDVVEDHRPFMPSNTGGKKRGQKATAGVAKNATEASRTFSGIAEAMADQWGNRSHSPIPQEQTNDNR